MLTIQCMKTIKVIVSESVYKDFQDFALRSDRKLSELIREAMEEYCRRFIERRTTLRDRHPVSVRGAIEAISTGDDLLREMLADAPD